MEAVQVLGQLKSIKNYVRLIYKCCVNSVNPSNLIKQELRRKDDTLIIRGNEYKLRNNCYVVGFGKAVLDMALATEDVIGDHIRAGAVSVPYGVVSQTKSPIPKTIKVFEGAKDNIPDEKAFLAAKSIVNIVETLNDRDFLLILISGGGSALLPYPIPPMTLAEKMLITTTLAKAGANIVELNAVRKRLSLVKGGKLTRMSYPAQTVALVISDVVNDPLDIIASGPTVPDKMPPSMAIDVLNKYNLTKMVPSHVMDILQKPELEEKKIHFSNSVTHIIANNNYALKAGADYATKDGFISKVMTTCLEGESKNVADSFAKLAGLLCQALGKTVTNKVFQSEFVKLSKDLCVSEQSVDELTKLIFQPSAKSKICLLFGGETTLKVTGRGIGGRNQELALRFSVAVDELAKTLHVIHLFNVVMLCAGTDGQDGPTDAAGAVCYNGQCKTASLQKLKPDEFIKENNSYVYYSLLDSGEDMLKSGLTGTNVMDVNVLTIQAKI